MAVHAVAVRRRAVGTGIRATDELAGVEGDERSFDFLETLELHGGLDVEVLFLQLGLDLDDAHQALVHGLTHRLLEAIRLDADQLDLTCDAAHPVLHLVDRVDVDSIETGAHGVDGPVDVVEAGIGAGDAIAEHDDGLVEPDTDATDIGVDVGNALADRFVDPGLGRDESLVDADLGLVDPVADDVGHLGLLASSLRRDLVDPGGERGETSVDLDTHLRGDLVDPGLGGLGDDVDVADDLAAWSSNLRTLRSRFTRSASTRS